MRVILCVALRNHYEYFAVQTNFCQVMIWSTIVFWTGSINIPDAHDVKCNLGYFNFFAEIPCRLTILKYQMTDC